MGDDLLSFWEGRPYFQVAKWLVLRRATPFNPDFLWRWGATPPSLCRVKKPTSSAFAMRRRKPLWQRRAETAVNVGKREIVNPGCTLMQFVGAGWDVFYNQPVSMRL